MSSAVEKVSDFFVGIVVLRSISFVITPPLVSIPSVSGVTSSSSTSLTSPASTPAWIAAPTATTSSGLTPWCGSLPVSSLTRSRTAGIRVMPPTRTTWSIVGVGVVERPFDRPDDPLQQVARSARSASSGVSFMSRCFGWPSTAVMKGRLICVSCVEESSIFAFSAAS